MFNVFADWTEDVKFVPANISHMHYRTLHYVDPVPSPRTNRKF